MLMLAPLVVACRAERSQVTGSSSAATPQSTESLPGSTPAGTRLRFGDKAVITVGTGAHRSRVGVIVTGVEKGTPEDSAALSAQYSDVLRARIPGYTPTSPVYFIRAILINEDGMNGGSY